MFINHYCQGCNQRTCNFHTIPWCQGHLCSLSSNICPDQLLASRSQLLNEAWEREYHYEIPTKFEKIKWHKVKIIKLGWLSENLVCPKLDDIMYVDPQLKYTHMCRLGKHTRENFKIEAHMNVLKVGKFIDQMMGVSHIELECHLWSMFFFRLLP